jgi:hypothetical protein
MIAPLQTNSMSSLVFYAPPVAPLLTSSSSSNVRCYRYSNLASNERFVVADLSGDVVADTSVLTTSGGITDVWKCTWFKDTGSTKVRFSPRGAVLRLIWLVQVAVKTFRIESTGQGELAKTYKVRTNVYFLITLDINYDMVEMVTANSCLGEARTRKYSSIIWHCHGLRPNSINSPSLERKRNPLNLFVMQTCNVDRTR